ncbi:hypothetical protein WAI453_009518 [Rhynchosporium graminicola]
MGPGYFALLKRGPSHGEYLLREKSLPEYLIAQFGRELGKEVENACGTKSVILSIVVYFAKVKSIEQGLEPFDAQRDY